MLALLSKRWEHVRCDDDYSNSYRLKVPGGWVIKSTSRGDGGIHQIFIKDPKHTWVLEDGQTSIS